MPQEASPKPHHIPAKLALVAGIATAALHPQSLAHDTPEEALQAPQPTVSLPHVISPHKSPAQPSSPHITHRHETPTPKPTEIPTIPIQPRHETKHAAPVADKEHWTSRPPAQLPIFKHPGETPPPPKELQDFHPESLSVPADVSSVMQQDVAYLPQLGCSGFLIHNQAGNPIGVETAQHCSLLAQDGHWDTSQPDQVTLKFPTPLEVETGDNLRDLSSVGDISQFILNNPKDNTHDQVIGVLEGQDPEEVYTAYQQNHLLPEEIQSLKKGDVIYNSGWPVDQPGNPGAMERQEFAMHVLGTATWDVTNGERLNLVIAAVPQNKDGAECSFGDSGSEGFVMQTVTLPDGTTQQVPRSIGTLSAFSDFGLVYNKKPELAAAEKQYIENTFGVSMDGYAGVCGFAYEVPTAENGMVIANVAVGETESESHAEAIDALVEQLDKELTDPTATRQIIHGIVEIPAKTPFWVKDPAFIYDPSLQALVVSYIGGGLGGGEYGEAFWVFDGPAALQNSIVYSVDGVTSPDLTTTSTGQLTADPNLPGAYTDPSGLVVSEYLGSDTKVAGKPYIFSTEGGQLQLYPELSK